jgi:hypothetical protein
MDTPRHLDAKLNYEEAREAIIIALKQEGFGVLTEIDVRATVKAKLNMDWRLFPSPLQQPRRLVHDGASNQGYHQQKTDAHRRPFP